eukprot:3902891-Amphidinium_carterae.1
MTGCEAYSCESGGNQTYGTAFTTTSPEPLFLAADYQTKIISEERASHSLRRACTHQRDTARENPQNTIEAVNLQNRKAGYAQ